MSNQKEIPFVMPTTPEMTKEAIEKAYEEFQHNLFLGEPFTIEFTPKNKPIGRKKR